MPDPIRSLFNLWLPSPLQKLEIPTYNAKKISVYAKRDDLIHAHVSGNKYRKLKFNMIAFEQGNYQQIVSFGGAFSNLLYTLSYIGKAGKIPMKFFIRGDGPDPENPSLKRILENGAQVEWLDRPSFRDIRKSQKLHALLDLPPDCFIIPEGGSNEMALPGGTEIVREIREQLGHDPDHIIMDLGTGGTFAGVLSAISPRSKLTGIPVLKGVDWEQTIDTLLQKTQPAWRDKNYEIIDKYHFGGFARVDHSLIEFINRYKMETGIPLDPIYTGKLIYALHDLISKDYFQDAKSIVWIHGGGLQGIAGFNYIHQNKFYLDPL